MIPIHLFEESYFTNKDVITIAIVEAVYLAFILIALILSEGFKSDYSFSKPYL